MNGRVDYLITEEEINLTRGPSVLRQADWPQHTLRKPVTVLKGWASTSSVGQISSMSPTTVASSSAASKRTGLQPWMGGSRRVIRSSRVKIYTWDSMNSWKAFSASAGCGSVLPAKNC
ncbi:synaptojanin-2-binding protein isoform X1 [Ovis aries]|uniref:synaptojanin-2-binding protein isoform X1 n=1 Tax=Ovis aries TaxID=9940 RepID=UPI00295271E1|nr:synaptojanin-2-binding protein isoform X1 [Ovis aries]